jgi:drug/metabolite transporter (DMT)-like permease
MNESPKVKLTAISWMVFNCFLAASMATIMKHASNDYSISSLMAGYNVIATIITYIWFVRSGESLRTEVFHLHLFRGILITISYFLYFYAIQLTKIANVVAIGYTDMVLTCLFSYIFLSEAINKVNAINLVLSLIGALLIIRPDTDIVNKGALFALMFTILWSFGNILVKMMGRKDSVLKQLFYSNFFMSIFSSSVAIYEGSLGEVMNAEILYWILPLAIMLIIQSFGLFKALNTARASIIMPFIVTNVIFGIILGYLFFDEVQKITSMIGTILVVAVSIYQIIYIRIGKF